MHLSAESSKIKELANEFLANSETGKFSDANRDELRTTVSTFFEKKWNTMLIFHRGIVLQYILDELFGLGPLEPLFRDKTVYEMQIFGADRLLYKRLEEPLLLTAKFDFLGPWQFERVLQDLKRASLHNQSQDSNVTLKNGSVVRLEFGEVNGTGTKAKVFRRLDDEFFDDSSNNPDAGPDTSPSRVPKVPYKPAGEYNVQLRETRDN